MLFRLNTLRAVVIDIPMQAKYGNEASTLSIKHSVFEFSYRHSVNFSKRIFYNYYLRDFHLASIEWLLGPVLFLLSYCQKWCSEISSSGGLVGFCHFKSIFEFNSRDHLGQVIEST